MNPQDRNLAEAEETYIVRLIKLLPEYGVMSKERQEAVISLVNQAETEALAKREQETGESIVEICKGIDYEVGVTLERRVEVKNLIKE